MGLTICPHKISFCPYDIHMNVATVNPLYSTSLHIIHIIHINITNPYILSVLRSEAQHVRKTPTTKVHMEYMDDMERIDTQRLKKKLHMECCHGQNASHMEEEPK